MSFYKWDEVTDHKDKVNELLSRRFIVGEKGMLIMIRLKKGCIVPKHKHPEEQFTYVVKGRVRYEAGKEAAILGEGSVAHLPGNVEHGVEALEDALCLDIFTPVRKELLP